MEELAERSMTDSELRFIDALFELRREFRGHFLELSRRLDDIDGSLEILWSCGVAHALEEIAELRATAGCVPLEGALAHNAREIKTRMVRQALREVRQNKMQAARLLGINVKTLYNILAETG